MFSYSSINEFESFQDMGSGRHQANFQVTSQTWWEGMGNEVVGGYGRARWWEGMGGYRKVRWREGEVAGGYGKARLW
jgi:hypothetical protein